MKGKIITREIFNSLIPRDGRFKDWTQAQRNALTQEIFHNTKKFVLGGGIQIPATEGHTDKQPLLGEVEDIKLVRRTYETTAKNGKKKKFDYFSIIANVKLIPEFYSLYKEDRLPGASVDLAEEGFLGDGKQYGPHIYALSFLGQTPPAFPNLQKDVKFKSKSKNLSFSCVPRRIYSQFSAQEFNAMPKTINTEKFQEQVVQQVAEALPEIVKGVVETLVEEETVVQDAVETVVEEKGIEAPDEGTAGEVAEGNYEGTPEEDKFQAEEEEFELKQEDEKRPPQKFEIEAKKELAEIRKERALTQFEALALKGHVTSADKKDFMQIAKSNSIKFAVDFFSKRKVKIPPSKMTLENKKNDEKNEKNEILQFKLNHAKKMGFSPEVIKNIERASGIKEDEKKQEAK